MTKKNIYLRATIGMALFVFHTLLFSEITFAYQSHDLDEFDDLEKKTDNNNDKDSKQPESVLAISMQKGKRNSNKSQAKLFNSLHGSECCRLDLLLCERCNASP